MAGVCGGQNVALSVVKGGVDAEGGPLPPTSLFTHYKSQQEKCVRTKTLRPEGRRSNRTPAMPPDPEVGSSQRSGRGDGAARAFLRSGAASVTGQPRSPQRLRLCGSV